MEQKKRDYYGNKIYPIVAQHHPDLAGKITGMILGTGVTEFNEKLDNESYLQNLCENPDFMKVQIKEAISILKNHNLLKSVRISVRNKFKKLIFSPCHVDDVMFGGDPAFHDYVIGPLETTFSIGSKNSNC